jgi:hypothetical protein
MFSITAISKRVTHIVTSHSYAMLNLGQPVEHGVCEVWWARSASGDNSAYTTFQNVITLPCMSNQCRHLVRLP